MASGLNTWRVRSCVWAIVGATAVLGCANAARAQVAYDVLHAFTREVQGPGSSGIPVCDSDGCIPAGGLIQAPDGNFYGTTAAGGAANGGTIFKLTAAGALTTLHSFECGTDGCHPGSSLIQAIDGSFYGTTVSGGTTGGGTVFVFTPDVGLTTLHSFDCSKEGCGPAAGLVQGIDGNFYGTTDHGGSTNEGTVFTITPAGALTTLYSFDCNVQRSTAG